MWHRRRRSVLDARNVGAASAEWSFHQRRRVPDARNVGAGGAEWSPHLRSIFLLPWRPLDVGQIVQSTFGACAAAAAATRRPCHPGAAPGPRTAARKRASRCDVLGTSVHSRHFPLHACHARRRRVASPTGSAADFSCRRHGRLAAAALASGHCDHTNVSTSLLHPAFAASARGRSHHRRDALNSAEQLSGMALVHHGCARA
mmetsp:Transcript_31412/g.86366  ORF Transcript_31412/g.86366 Transcript_31412/m.86366 type:complete len:202 (-) Transcript_31412:2-607(-)